MLKALTGFLFSIAAAGSLHADVAQYWPDWLSMNAEGQTQGKIVREILGQLRPRPLDTSRLVQTIAGSDSIQLGAWVMPKEGETRNYFGFIAWSFNTYTVRDEAKQKSVTPWPFSQAQVHDRIIEYLMDNQLKPRIQYFSPVGVVRNGGTLYQWTEESSPRVVVRVIEVPGVQTTISFFSEEDFRRVDFRRIERIMTVGEIPLVQFR